MGYEKKDNLNVAIIKWCIHHFSLYECRRKRTFEFPQGNETRRLPKRKRLAQIALFEKYRIVLKRERFARPNWAMVRNQLMVNSKFQSLMQKYENSI